MTNGKSGGTLRQRGGHQHLASHGYDGQVHTEHAAHVASERTRRVHHRLGLDRAGRGQHPRDAILAHLHTGDFDVCQARRPEVSRRANVAVDHAARVAQSVTGVKCPAQHVLQLQ